MGLVSDNLITSDWAQIMTMLGVFDNINFVMLISEVEGQNKEMEMMFGISHSIKRSQMLKSKVFLSNQFSRNFWGLKFVSKIVKTPTPTQHNTTVGFDTKMTVQTPPPTTHHPQKLFRHF